MVIDFDSIVKYIELDKVKQGFLDMFSFLVWLTLLSHPIISLDL